jgi:hypothetical protein
MAIDLSSEETASVAQGAVLESTTRQNISQAQQARLDAASDVLLRNATRNSTGSPTLKDLTATSVYNKPDGTLVITTQSGQEYTASRDDQEFYNEKNNENTLIVREQNNEIETFKAWAREQGFYRLGQTDTITSIADLQRDPYFKDFQNYVVSVEQTTGFKPYGTPYQDYLVTKTLQDTTLEDTPRTQYPQVSVVDPFVNSGRRPVGSVALASDELAALKRAVGSNSNTNQQKVDQSLGFVEIPTSFARQNNALLAQRLADEQRLAVSLEEQPTSTDSLAAGVPAIDKVNVANQAASADASASASQSASRRVALRPNPLDAYESHSYTISLHILTQNEYNAMVSTDRTQTFSPSTTLISGAGMTGAGAPRAKGWEDDFFFESLKLSSVIGLNSTSRGTNVIDCDFTIIEPYGLSLIDRLIVTTDELSNSKGKGLYFANCYLIEINFYSADGGKIADMKKFIPIRLTGMTIKASARGSEYRCTAVPFSHHALSQTRASTPATFTVSAGTLEEFFRSEDSASAKVSEEGAREITQLREAVASRPVGTASNTNVADARKVDEDKLKALADKNYEVKSYVAAYNEWQNTLVRLKVIKVKTPNKIAVVFDTTFTENGGNKVYRQRDQDGTVAASTMAKGNDAKNGDNVRANQVQDNFTFVAGTQITQVINTAMQSSEFIRKQIVLQDQAKAGGATEVQGLVTWWKIIPLVKLQEFDEKNNQWSFDTTYYVVPYTVWNTTHPSLPKAVPDRSLCSKEYPYFYTGQNTSVIDFAIDFDFVYFTKVTALREKNLDNSFNADRTENPETDSNTTQGKGFNPSVKTYVSDDPTNTGKNLRRDATAMAVANVSESLYSSAGGEMLNITLKIIGDPELIKQDDVFTGVTASLKKKNEVSDNYYTGNNPTFNNVAFQQNKPSQSDSTKKNNNSIVMDSAEVVCWVEIRSPVDIDDRTGGVRFYDNNKLKSGFTGVYKLLMVDSDFSRGQFTQTLNLIRYMDQDANLPTQRIATSNLAPNNSGDGRTSYLKDIGDANNRTAFVAETYFTPVPRQKENGGSSYTGGVGYATNSDPLDDFVATIPSQVQVGDPNPPIAIISKSLDELKRQAVGNGPRFRETTDANGNKGFELIDDNQ